MSNVVDIYDTATNTWSTATLSQARREVAATSLGSKVFFGGGQTGSGYSAAVDIYDTATNLWSTASLSQARTQFSATSAGGKVFFAGGYANTGFSNVVDIYDMATNSWSTSNLSQARYYLSATSAGGKAFFAGGASGPYTLAVVDIYTATVPTQITQGPTPANQTVCADGSATTTVTATGQTMTYQWYRNHPTTDEPVAGQTTATLSLSNVTAAQSGTYYLQVSGAGGVAWSSAFTVQVMELGISSTNVTCHGGINGTATVRVSGGQAPYTYSWSPSGGVGATASGLSAGTYTVTVTDAGGTFCEKSVSITQPSALIFTTSQTNVTCNGGSNGTAMATVTGGTGSKTYRWFYGSTEIYNFTNSINGLAAGGYSFIVTDANHCSTTLPFLITQPAAVLPVITSNGATTFCAGGSVSLSTTGAFSTYSWKKDGNEVGTSATYSATSGGSYTVTVTDANGCSGTSSATSVTVNPLPDASFSGLSGPYCVGTASLPLTPITPGGTFSLSGPGSLSGNTYSPPASGGGGTATITYSVATGGCNNTSQQTVQLTGQTVSIASLSSGSFCAGQTLSLSFSATCPNTFTARLSNQNGNFASALSLGGVNPNTPNTLTLPIALPSGSGYLIEVVGSNGSGVTSAFSIEAIIFTSTPTVQAISPGNAPPQSSKPVCAGSAANLSFTINCIQPVSGLIAQLSDGSGSFSSGITALGAVNAGSSSLIIPGSVADGHAYRIRILAGVGGAVSTASAAFRIRECNNNVRLAPEREAAEGGLLVSVRPNPVSQGLLAVSVRGGMGQTLKVELLNAAGQVVRQQQVEQAQSEESLNWDISRQPQGLYLLRVSSEREARTVKVVH